MNGCRPRTTRRGRRDRGPRAVQFLPEVLREERITCVPVAVHGAIEHHDALAHDLWQAGGAGVRAPLDGRHKGKGWGDAHPCIVGTLSNGSDAGAP